MANKKYYILCTTEEDDGTSKTNQVSFDNLDVDIGFSEWKWVSIKSPNGTSFRILVDDDWVLYTDEII